MSGHSETGMPEPARTTRLRSDARRNRTQIIAASKDVFAEHGPDLPMEVIARHAGVGVGTLYRHFPSRDTLVRAVAQDSFAAVIAHADAANAEEPTAWAVLVRLAGHTQQLRVALRLAIASPRAWTAISSDPPTQELRAQLIGTVDTIVRAAQQEGALRTDVSAGDIAVLLAMLLQPLPVADDAAAIATERTTALVLEGIRARPDPHRLPGHPLPAGVLGRQVPFPGSPTAPHPNDRD